jgi:nucleotide-binding universal stress UspA family protein
MNSRPGRVVVGYDASEHGRRAVLWAADEAAHRGDLLVVVHAVDYRGLGLRGPVVMARAWARIVRDEAREIAAEGAAIARLAVPGLVVDIATGVGGPVPILVQESQDADLLVLGAHGLGRDASEMLSPVVEGAAGQAFCPVVVIDGGERSRPGPDRPVVVGVDGSLVALQAVDFAAAEAEAAGARLRIVSAWSRPRRAPSTTLVEFTEAAAGPSEAAARAAVAEAVARTRAAHPAVDVKGTAFCGEATRVLADQAMGAGLLVVGRRATPRPPAALGPALGSVGRRMVRTCPCPVMFVGPAAISPPCQRREERNGRHRALRGTPLGARW